MSVTFELEPALEDHLRNELRDLDAAAKEAFLVSLYRQSKLSQFALSQALGLDRLETEELLHRHNVTEDLPTAQELLSDAAALEQLRVARR